MAKKFQVLPSIMKKNKDKVKISTKRYQTIAHTAFLTVIVLALLSVVVSIASFLIPYSPSIAIWCVLFHKLSVLLIYLIVILLGIAIFCDC